MSPLRPSVARRVLLGTALLATGCGAAGESLAPTRAACAGCPQTEVPVVPGVAAEAAALQILPKAAPPPVQRREPSPLADLTREQLWADYNAARGDAYALDATPRRLDEGERRPSCETDELVAYDGELVRFQHVVRVHPAFAERLRRFERVVNEVAAELYGRVPSRLRHLGAFSCRKARFRSRRISEHALGNAIDVAGFDFDPAPKYMREELTPELRRGFRVGVERHWDAGDDPTSQRHAEFLRRLTRRLVDDAVFRVTLGPSHRGHHDHFHFDMSPWSYVHL